MCLYVGALVGVRVGVPDPGRIPPNMGASPPRGLCVAPGSSSCGLKTAMGTFSGFLHEKERNAVQKIWMRSDWEGCTEPS